MAVLSCTLQPNRDFSRDSEQRREHSEKFIIVCNRSTYSGRQVDKLAARVGPHPLPRMHDPHPTDRNATVKRVQINQLAPDVFEATVQYDTEQKNDSDREEHPLRKPVRYSLELMQFERPVDKDINGTPILNACGEPFDPPLMHDDSRQVLVGVRNIQSLGEIVYLQQFYKDAVNLNPFHGAGPRQAKVVSITAGEQQRAKDIDFYEVAIRVAFKENGETWVREVLNQGMAYFRDVPDPNNADSTIQKLTTKRDGEFINSPVKLDADGYLLEDDAEPVFLKFKTYPERDFRGLGI